MNRSMLRSRNSMIGGVAAGLAEWMNSDPGLVRIAWALLVPITGGAALLAYIVAWVVLPEAPAAPANNPAGEEGDAATQDSPSRPIDRRRTQLVLGGGLVLVGLWFLVREYLPDIDWAFVWPLVLVAGGIAILISASRRS